MTIVHIGFKYGLKNTGGAAIASTRLHLALLDAGIDSHYVCVHKMEEGPNVHELPTGWRRVLFFALTKFTRCIWKFTAYRRSMPLNVVPLFGLKKLIRKINPDAVHIQWINADVASLEQLGRLRSVVGPSCKIVFNLHDLYLVLQEGGYPDDRRYIDGFRLDNSTRLERWLVSRKKRMIKELDPIFIGPSKWVCEQCRQSIVGRGYKTYPIPNIIDPIFSFHPEKYVPGKKFIVLFGSFGGRRNHLKGWSDLVAALRLLPSDIACKTEVHVFGETGSDEIINGIQVKVIGNISDPRQLLEIYHHADVFAFPSVQETQGMTKVEAMLCGLPVVAFDRTACAEGIEQGKTGWIAADGDVAGFSAGIEWVYGLWKSHQMAEQRAICSDHAKSIYEDRKICSAIMDAYVCDEIKNDVDSAAVDQTDVKVVPDSSIGGVSVSPELSTRFRNMAVVAAFCVVVLHCGGDAVTGSPGWYVHRVLQGLSKCSVPFFFFASGFFLARHVGAGGWWWNEVRKRMLSLVIPFFLWGAIYWLYLFAMAVISTLQSGTPLSQRHAYLFGWNLVIALSGFDLLHPPFYSVTWYLRSLFLYVLVTPLLIPIIHRFRWILFILLYVVDSWGFGVSFPGSTLVAGLSWYVLGVSCRTVPIRSSGFGWYCAIGAVIAILLKVAFDVLAINLPFSMFGFTIPLSLGAVWCLTTSSLPKVLKTTTMPVYLLHSFFISIFVIAFRFDDSQWWVPLLKILFAYVLSVSAAWLLYRIVPNISRLLFGIREGVIPSSASTLRDWLK